MYKDGFAHKKKKNNNKNKNLNLNLNKIQKKNEFQKKIQKKRRRKE